MGCAASTHDSAPAAAPVEQKQKQAAAPVTKNPKADADASLVVPAVPGSLPNDATIIFVLGGPGSGKGTQCDRIKAKYAGVVHLSAGDLLRAEVDSGSVVGQKCAELMKNGELVPQHVTITLLKNAMIQSGGSLFLIDGFPRALDQAHAFESSIMPCKAVLFFDCPEDEMEKRLLKRGETSGRADDNAETIRKRFKTFLEQSLPVKDLYLPQGKCYVISAVPPPEEVFEEVCKAMDATLASPATTAAAPVAAAAAAAPEVAAPTAAAAAPEAAVAAEPQAEEQPQAAGPEELPAAAEEEPAGDEHHAETQPEEDEPLEVPGGGAPEPAAETSDVL